MSSEPVEIEVEDEPIRISVPPPPVAMDPGLERLREDLEKLERPTHVGLRGLAFALSLGAFAWGLRAHGWRGGAVLVAVMLAHEAGHLAAMKAFGYRDLKVFFVPFFGAAATGRASAGGAWRAGLVSLAGPVPGLLVGALLVPRVAHGGDAWTTSLAWTLVFVNGLNLLPLLPLDGGRLLNTVLFSRHPALELVAGAVGGIGLALLVDLPQPWSLAIPGLVIVGLAFRARILKEAHRLRALGIDFAGRASALGDRPLSVLRDAAHEVLSGQPVLTRGTVAATVAQVQEATEARPAGALAAVVLFAVWLSALGLAARSWNELRAPAPAWHEVTGPEDGWRAAFPTHVRLSTEARPEGVRALRSAVATLPGTGTFTLVAITYDTNEPVFDRATREETQKALRASSAELAGILKATITDEEPIELAGRPALASTLEGEGGARARVVRVGQANRAFVLVAEQVGSDADADHFFSSFVLPPR